MQLLKNKTCNQHFPLTVAAALFCPRISFLCIAYRRPERATQSPSLNPLIWFHPFKHCTYILILRLALQQRYSHINTRNHFTVPHLLFRTSLPPLLTNKFNKTSILTNYRLLLPATLKNASLDFFFSPPYSHTLAPMSCRSYALGTPIYSHCIVIWIGFHSS